MDQNKGFNDKADKNEPLKESKQVISEAGNKLTDDELEQVSGGRLRKKGDPLTVKSPM